MLRRLCTVLLVLACAFAPALPALETSALSDDCGCGRACCGTSDCALPPAPAHTTTTLGVVGAVETHASVSRPAPRAMAGRAISFFSNPPVRLQRDAIARRAMEVVASAPLYRVHCTFLI